MGAEAVKAVLDAEQELRENLLPVVEARALEGALHAYLEEVFRGPDIHSLRYRKMRRGSVWVAMDRNGLPGSPPWPKFEPYLALLAQVKAERTIKNRLKVDDLFIESRSQGEDLHVLIGRRDGTGVKAHVIADAKTGEIRVEDNQLEPTELVRKIEVILHLNDGRRILTTRQALELLD